MVAPQKAAAAVSQVGADEKAKDDQEGFTERYPIMKYIPYTDTSDNRLRNNRFRIDAEYEYSTRSFTVIVTLNTFEVNKVEASLIKGEITTFGSYDWLVLDVRSDKALLITKDIIETRAYNTELQAVTWEKCTLRAYLNGEFYNRFSKEEKRIIVESYITNTDNAKYGTAGGRDTNDKVFLLSLDEVRQYFKNDTSRIAHYRHQSGWWWLRSPGASNAAANVGSEGEVFENGYYVHRAYGGVRPALWVKLES